MAPLAELCDIHIGRTPRRAEREYWGVGWPWLVIADMKGRVITSTSEQITPHAVHEVGGYCVAPGTVLLSFKLSIGKVAIAGVPMFTNEAIAALPVRDVNVLDANYLALALDVLDLATGTNRAVMGATLNKHKLATIQIPLPPLTEQRRIVSILDAAISLREKRRRTLLAIPELASAVFAHTFTDTERRRWDYLSIGALCDISSGGTPNRAVSDNFNGDIPWIKSGELHDPVIVSSEETITDCGLRSSSAKILAPETVLVAMYGATAGVVSELAIPAATNQAICALEPREKLRTPFLVFALRESMPNLLALRAGGAQPNLSQARIREHQLPVPPLHLQDEFSALHRRVMSQKELALRHLAQLDALFASLQHRAFKGEL